MYVCDSPVLRGDVRQPGRDTPWRQEILGQTPGDGGGRGCRGGGKGERERERTGEREGGRGLLEEEGKGLISISSVHAVSPPTV